MLNHRASIHNHSYYSNIRLLDALSSPIDIVNRAIELNIDMIGIKKEQGGSLEDSFTLEGVAFKKCFSYAGFEQQPKLFYNPKIVCLNIELEFDLVNN